MDAFDKVTRSRVMSRIKSTGTKSTEWKFRSLLMRAGIRDWKIGHHTGLPGSPDFIFHSVRVVVFVDGCFWHGCRYCRTIPRSNRAFWFAKIQKNRIRDKKVKRSLHALGWKVLRIWEHELKENSEASLLQTLKKYKVAPSV